MLEMLSHLWVPGAACAPACPACPWAAAKKDLDPYPYFHEIYPLDSHFLLFPAVFGLIRPW